MDNNDREIFSSRLINAPLEHVYAAFVNPEQLKIWWGPEGFTNTIHEFDLKPGGKWLLTMHGPDKGNFENSSVFEMVKPLELVRWKRMSQPFFDMEVGFKSIDETHSEISFRMIFDSPDLCNKMKPFVVPKNEENFDRLVRLIEWN
jgi:Activator of Hsp90 ATPase homolog 1-like protein